jgi:DNA-binding FrmR family transcriptional regulator
MRKSAAFCGVGLLDRVIKSTKLARPKDTATKTPKTPAAQISAGAISARRLGRSMVTERQPTELSVSHTIREKTKLLNRVRRIRGQIEAVERALDHEIGCADVLQLIAGARGAINGLMAEVMEDHVRAHLIDPAREPDPERAHAAEELIDVVRSYLK